MARVKGLPGFLTLAPPGSGTFGFCSMEPGAVALEEAQSLRDLEP